MPSEGVPINQAADLVQAKSNASVMGPTAKIEKERRETVRFPAPCCAPARFFARFSLILLLTFFSFWLPDFCSLFAQLWTSLTFPLTFRSLACLFYTGAQHAREGRGESRSKVPGARRR